MVEPAAARYGDPVIALAVGVLVALALSIPTGKVVRLRQLTRFMQAGSTRTGGNGHAYNDAADDRDAGVRDVGVRDVGVRDVDGRDANGRAVSGLTVGGSGSRGPVWSGPALAGPVGSSPELSGVGSSPGEASGARLQSPGLDVALALDLLAAALASGVPVGAAVRSVGVAMGGQLGEALRQAGAAMLLGAAGDLAWQPSPSTTGARSPDPGQSEVAVAIDLIRRLMEVCLAAGGQAGAVLRAGADAERRRRRREREAAAARLPVRLVLPLGICALPAFLAVGVTPVVISLAADFLR